MEYKIGEEVWVVGHTIGEVFRVKILDKRVIDKVDVYNVRNGDLVSFETIEDYLFRDKLDALMRLKDLLTDKIAIAKFDIMTSEKKLESTSKLIGELE